MTMVYLSIYLYLLFIHLNNVLYFKAGVSNPQAMDWYQSVVC